MRRFSLGLILLIAGSGVFARADTNADCVQNSDRELQIRACNKVLREDDEAAWALFNRGLAYNATKRHEEALKDFTRYIALKPNDHTGYNDRGNAKVRLGKEEDALLDYAKAIKIKPDYARGYNNRGEAYENMEKLDLALEAYSKAIELDPKYARAYSNRGDIYRKKEMRDKAIADYGRALGIDPNLASAREELIKLGVAP